MFSYSYNSVDCLSCLVILLFPLSTIRSLAIYYSGHDRLFPTSPLIICSFHVIYSFLAARLLTSTSWIVFFFLKFLLCCLLRYNSLCFPQNVLIYLLILILLTNLSSNYLVLKYIIQFETSHSHLFSHLLQLLRDMLF